MNPEKALLVATIAHGAVGQMRAAGVPYIVHPIKVALLSRWFYRKYYMEIDLAAIKDGTFDYWGEESLLIASYLHDVLEDTKLTRQHLIDAGIHYIPLDIVERLTIKPVDGKTPSSYYAGIADHTGALVVKAADRCANLEDARSELFHPVETREVRRWANYVQATYDDVLPMYEHLPGLRSELEWRLRRIQTALPKQKAEREAYVERDRIERGIPPGKQFILSHALPKRAA